MTVVAGSAAMTLSLAAITPDAAAHRQGAGPAQSHRIAGPDTLHQQVNAVMRLEKSSLQHVNVTPEHPLEGAMPVVIDGVPMTITHWPHSVRSDHYRVWAQVDDGSLVEVEPTPERTIRGVIDELPGSVVFGSLLDDGLHAGFLVPDGRLLWIEPVARYIDGAEPAMHVLYDADDADCEGGTCGAPNHWFNHLVAGENGDQDMMMSIECKIAEIAFDVDFQYFQALGNTTNVINNVNSIVNAINSNQYEGQVGIVHEITEIVIRTSAGANPYTTSSPSALLNQFRDVWRTSPESSIPRDLAHLLTGRNLSGSVIGVAWVGTVCHSPQGHHYGLSQRLTGFSCMTDLVAHEVGHNWNAGHCCPGTTMNSSLTCANFFGQTSINQILNFKNSVNCLDPCVPPEPPANNTCQNRIVVTDGTTSFSNEHATTDGPNEPEECTFFGNTQIQKDVWFEYTATCTGEVTFSLCNSFFTTKLGVYDSSTCPTQPDTIASCDITSCASNRSRLVLPAVEGESFIIRVGGRVDQEGVGSLAITCEETGPDCVGDLDGNGVVDSADLLILLSDWGSCPSCDSDLDGNDVVDSADLLILLANWGNCP